MTGKGSKPRKDPKGQQGKKYRENIGKVKFKRCARCQSYQCEGVK